MFTECPPALRVYDVLAASERTIFHRTMAQRMPLSYVVAIAALVCWSLLALTLHLNGIWLGAGVLAVMVALAGTGRAE